MYPDPVEQAQEIIERIQATMPSDPNLSHKDALTDSSAVEIIAQHIRDIMCPID